MTQTCAPLDPVAHYVSGMMSFVDCQTANLAEQGYRAIGAGTLFAPALDGLLVIAVAVFGYRMLMGETLALRDGMVLLVKIGFVLALAQHWAAYRPVVFDFATRAPQALVATLFGEGGGRQGGVETGLASRVEDVDLVIGQILYPERETRSGSTVISRPPVPAGADAANLAGSELAPDVRAQLSSADTTMILALLVSGVGLRIALGVLLALGPVFVATLLFGTTRTMFAGWVRAVLGTMIGMIGVPVVTAFELTALEPQVAALARAFNSGSSLGSIAERLWLTSSLFAAVLALVLVLIVRASTTLRFPNLSRLIIDRLDQSVAAGIGQGPGQLPLPAHANPAIRDHAQHIADAAKIAERRDDPPARAASFTSIIERQRDSRQPQYAIVSGAGQRGGARAANNRVSAAAQRRDGS